MIKKGKKEVIKMKNIEINKGLTMSTTKRNISMKSISIKKKCSINRINRKRKKDLTKKERENKSLGYQSEKMKVM